jgi:hypothetical protein
MKRRGTSLLWPLLAAALLSALAVGTGLAEIKVSGYTQARYNLFDDSMYKEDEFDLRRVRLKVKGPINDQGTVATLQVEFSGLDDHPAAEQEVVLRDARVDHPLGESWRARVGLAQMPFGFEVPYSSSNRLPLERSRVARVLFPSETDTGFYVTRTSHGGGDPELVLGYGNGIEAWDDAKQRAALVRMQWPLPSDGVAGLSYMDASRTRDGTDYDQDVLGAHLRWQWESGFAFQAEYYDGEFLGADVYGWYGQVEYAVPQSRWAGYYRYDVYDDGRATPDDFDRSTLGAAYELDAKQRLTLQVESLDNELGVSATNYGFQWQFKY